VAPSATAVVAAAATTTVAANREYRCKRMTHPPIVERGRKQRHRRAAGIPDSSCDSRKTSSGRNDDSAEVGRFWAEMSAIKEPNRPGFDRLKKRGYEQPRKDA
jgi:hypothetical protein